MARSFVLLLALALPLAGCLGSNDGEGADEPIKRQRADVSTSLGGIEGLVTDTAVQPVGGVNVTIVETNRTVATAPDGSFAFSNVVPATYTLAVRGGQYVSASQTVVVAAGEVAVVDFILTHLLSEAAYTQAFELVGFFECGFEVGANSSSLPDPAPPELFLGVAVCAVPNSVLQDLGAPNATNDRFLHNFELDPPIDTMVYEMHWEPASQFSEQLSTNVEVRGFPNDAIGRFVLEKGPSPIQVRVDKDRWTQLDEEFRQACEDGTDEYCDYSFWDNGWPLWTRVFPAWECFSEATGGCVALQQEFTHVITAFYNLPAPDGYTALGG